MANKLWGRIPNVIEQRLLVTIYQAGRAMTNREFLDLAATLGLMNVAMNLDALVEKGLLVRNAKEQLALTPAGIALTTVGLDHKLFATPKELADLVKRPVPPETTAPAQQAAKQPIPPPFVPTTTDEKAAQRIWNRETSRAEASRLAESSSLASELRRIEPRRTETPTPATSPREYPPTVTPLRPVATASVATSAALVILPKQINEPPPPKPAIEELKAKPPEVSTPKPAPQAAPVAVTAPAVTVPTPTPVPTPKPPIIKSAPPMAVRRPPPPPPPPRRK